MTHYEIKVADCTEEREQIHRLNYETFVEEIPQHAPNPERRLVDRFDAENEYVIALAADRTLAGMVALRAKRPFSLDQKLERLDEHLPPYRSICELRLLALRREHRHRFLLRDLLVHAARRCITAGHDLAVISGTLRQLDLYRHLGFEPFGPRVGAPGAQFQPMVLSLERFLASAGATLRVTTADPAPSAARFTPGPVDMLPATRAAMAGAPLGHRAPEVAASVRGVRRMMCSLTGAADAALIVGTGTLANDMVAWALRATRARGLVAANGEFGERLLEQARCAGLAFDALRLPWGAPLEERSLAEALRRGGAAWLWAVHGETSTGVLNDFAMLARLAREAGARLCLDCVSTIGNVPLSLDGVWLASASSGKGLGGFAGLAAVLTDGTRADADPPTPRYLDLGHWLRCDSLPFTHSSNLVAALEAALSGTDWAARQRAIANDGRWLRAALRARGLQTVGPDAVAHPAVVTLALPSNIDAGALAGGLASRGFELAWRSGYLAQRNWMQAALMGEYDRVALRRLPEAMSEALREQSWHGDRAA